MTSNAALWQMTWEERHTLANNEGLMLLFDKPKEYTSTRIVNIVKKFLNVNKAGHSGTLDPKATGLMLICTGKKTKALNDLLGCDKEYEGLMIIGEKTKSFDSETEVYEKIDTAHVTREILDKAVRELTGEISQVPPMYSAVKYKGKPLYKMARKGHVMEIAPRTINVKEFELTSFNGDEIGFRVLCSKGTYIRSLVSDMGDKLGTGAYLKELRRTKIGDYDIKDALDVEDFINRNRK